MPAAFPSRGNSGIHAGGSGALLLGVVGALVTLQARAATCAEPQAPVLVEQAVKAAYVYNFTKFVSWPVESPLTRAHELTIGVLGDDSLAATVETTVRDKHAEGRPLAVRRFRAVDEVVPCSVLFVASAMAKQMPQLLQRLQGWPVLTVSDAEGFTARGGVIGLLLEDNRVRFEIGVTSAQAAGLQVSSKLLRLSRPVPARACATCAAGSGGER
jgi:hypothetical protein